MKKKETVNQQEWKKEEARAKRLIKKYEKQGFVFDFEIPKKPKRITKQALEELKRETRATKILSKGVRVVDQVTGETETARKAIEKKRSASAKRAQSAKKRASTDSGITDIIKKASAKDESDVAVSTDVVLNNFYNLCDYWTTSPKNRNIHKTVGMLRSAVDRFIGKYGKDAVAQAIEESALTTYFGDIILYEKEVRSILDQINDIADQIVLNVRKENGEETDEE